MKAHSVAEDEWNDTAPPSSTGGSRVTVIVLLIVAMGLAFWLISRPILSRQSAAGLSLDAPAKFDAGRDVMGEMPEDGRSVSRSCRLYTSGGRGMTVEINLLEIARPEATPVLDVTVDRWLEAHKRMLSGTVSDESTRRVAIGGDEGWLGGCRVTNGKDKLVLRVMVFAKDTRVWTVGCIGSTSVDDATCDQVMQSVRLEP